MPDQWGRPQMSDWMGMAQAIGTYGQLQDQNKQRRDKQGVEKAMGFISGQQEDGTALEDIERPSEISEQHWASALVQKHKLNEAAYSRWAQEFAKNKQEAQKALAVLKEQRDSNVPENQRKEALFDFYNKHVYDNTRYLGSEIQPDGSHVNVFYNSVTDQRIEQPDKSADEMLWAADDYISRWFDKTAPVARSKRIEKNIAGLLNPIEMVNESGDKIYLYEQVKRGNDGYEPVIVRKNPAKDIDKQAPIDFIETTVEEWVAKGYKAKPRVTPDKALDIEKSKMDISGKKADQMRDSMDFIAKQLGVIPDKKKGSNDDLMALAMGEEQTATDMPPTSTLKGILDKIEGGSQEEKALATSWMQMAGELYPGLKNLPDEPQKGKGKVTGGGVEEIPIIDDDFLLGDDDAAEIVKAEQAKRAKEKEIQSAQNSKASRKIDEQLPGFSASLNKNYPQGTAVNMPQEGSDMPRRGQPVIAALPDQRPDESIEVDRQHPGFSESLNKYYAQSHPGIQAIPAPHEQGPVPFQHNPDEEALAMIQANRPRR